MGPRALCAVTLNQEALHAGAFLASRTDIGRDDDRNGLPALRNHPLGNGFGLAFMAGIGVGTQEDNADSFDPLIQEKVGRVFDLFFVERDEDPAFGQLRPGAIRTTAEYPFGDASHVPEGNERSRMFVELPFGLFQTRLTQPGEATLNSGIVFKAARDEQPHLCAGPGHHQVCQCRAGINDHLGGGVDLTAGHAGFLGRVSYRFEIALSLIVRDSQALADIAVAFFVREVTVGHRAARVQSQKITVGHGSSSSAQAAVSVADRS